MTALSTPSRAGATPASADAASAVSSTTATSSGNDAQMRRTSSGSSAASTVAPPSAKPPDAHRLAERDDPAHHPTAGAGEEACNPYAFAISKMATTRP